jgi:hypothetical protein
MSKTFKGGLLVLGAGLLLAVALVPLALAGKPEMERIDIDVTFPDDFLSAECGFAVTTNQRGHIIFREWPDREKGTLAVNTLNFALTAMANGNSYRFRDVGADHVKVTKDGPILSIIGQVPFDFIGVLKINLDTDEVVHEPGHDISGRLAEACAKLSA